MPVTKIISGAQTGADRAGLEAALTLGLSVGGTVPLGRKTDEGRLTDEEMRMYNLHECGSPYYPKRTRSNVKHSDGTVLFGSMSSPGTRLTMKYCGEMKKPYLINPTPDELRFWIEDRGIQVLNVAGNRERTNPGIYERTYRVILEALRGQ